MNLLRVALAPGGVLHVGNARIVLATWLFARSTGGRILLHAETAARHGEDLAWLGLDWDGTYDSHDFAARRADAIARLRSAGRLYPCFESEEELATKQALRLRRGQPAIYDRAMLKLTPAQREAAEAGGKAPYWRFRLGEAELTWQDLILGRRRVKLLTLSDPVVIRADGTVLQRLAAVIDDLALGVSHVLRGEDQIDNTAIQLDLMAALGANPGAIALAHLPPLLDAEGTRLSRRIDGLALRDLRQDGIVPAALAATLAGADRPAMPAELIAGFDLARFAAADRFAMAKLLTINRAALAALPFEAIADRLPAGATAAFWHAIRGGIDLLGEARGCWEITNGTIIPPVIEDAGTPLRQALELLPAEPWRATVWAEWLAALEAASGRDRAALDAMLRLALTGEESGPDLARLLPLIGRGRAADRLRLAAR
ncbi:MAG: glutamate--tRNA ligase [Rhodospirillales bacterium]|nr:glutamate--tRNA ligase [Rhodospirillales bacterium]MDE2198627.1 glutamate--tRNA ligase [Rhodospirillales bacterium]